MDHSCSFKLDIWRRLPYASWSTHERWLLNASSGGALDGEEVEKPRMQLCKYVFFISESFWMLCLLPGMLFPSVPHCCYCSYCGLVARKKNKEDWNECNCYDFFVFLTGSLGKYSPWICAKFRRHYVFQFLLEGGFWC